MLPFFNKSRLCFRFVFDVLVVLFCALIHGYRLTGRFQRNFAKEALQVPLFQAYEESQPQKWVASDHERFMRLAGEYETCTGNEATVTKSFEDQFDDFIESQEQGKDDTKEGLVRIYAELDGSLLLETKEEGRMFAVDCIEGNLKYNLVSNKNIPVNVVVGQDWQQVWETVEAKFFELFERHFEQHLLWDLFIQCVACDEMKYSWILKVAEKKRSKETHPQLVKLGFALIEALHSNNRTDLLEKHGNFLKSIWEEFVDQTWCSTGLSFDWDWDLTLDEHSRRVINRLQVGSSWLTESTSWSLSCCMDVLRGLPSSKSVPPGWSHGPISFKLLFFCNAEDDDIVLASDEDEKLTMLWLSNFYRRYEALRRIEKNESACQKQLQLLLRTCLSLDASKTTCRVVAIGVLSYLTRFNFQHYGVFVMRNLEAIVASVLSSPSLPVTIGLLDLVDQVTRKREYCRSVSFDTLLSDKNDELVRNDWLCGNLVSILWRIVDKQEEVEALLKSTLWEAFLERLDSIPPLFRFRVMKAMTPFYEQLPLDLLDNQVFFDEFGDAALLLRCEQFVLDNYEQNELLPVLYLSLHSDASASLQSVVNKLVTSSANVRVCLVECFLSARGVGRVKSLVESNLPVLVSALEQAQEDLELDWVKSAWGQLLPFAAAVHTHKDSMLFDRMVSSPLYKSSNVLSLSRGGIAGADLFSIQFEKMKSTTEVLDLSKNEIGDEGAAVIAQWLTDTSHNIHTIDISRNSISSAGVGSLADCLKYSKTLKTLDISENDLSSDGTDITGIIKLSESLIWNTTLLELDMSNTTLPPDSVAYLTKALSFNGTLIKFNLWNTTGVSAVQLNAVNQKLQLNEKGACAAPHTVDIKETKKRRKSQDYKDAIVKTISVLKSSGKKLVNTEENALDKFITTTVQRKGEESDGKENLSSIEMEIKELQESIHGLRSQEKNIFTSQNMRKNTQHNEE